MGAGADDTVYDLCVVGSGIAALSSIDTFLTARPDAKVLVLEKEARLGGHDYTVEVANGGDKVLVDCGFMVYNERTYPNMLKLFEKYNIESKLSDMSLSTYYKPAGAGVADTWSFGGSGAWILHNVWRPRLWRFMGSHKRFREAACEVLAGEDVFRVPGAKGAAADASSIEGLCNNAATLGQFCAYLKDAEFCDHWLRPFVKAVWSLPSDDESNGYPLLPLLRFMENHGFLADPAELTPWRTPKHRSQAIVAAILGFAPDSPNHGKHIRCLTNAAVTGVAEPKAAAGPVYITAAFPGENAPQTFAAHHVVLAASGPAQAAMVKAGVPARFDILSKLKVSYTKGILHRDARYMPARRSDWSAWNVGETHTTYWLNKIQGQPEPNLFFTLPLEGFYESEPAGGLAQHEEDPIGARIQDIIHVWDTTHPRYDRETTDAVALLKKAARGSRIQHAGAWMRHGFHEDGIVSGRLAARELLAASSPAYTGPPQRLPVYYPMATNPNVNAKRVAVPLTHAVLEEAAGEDGGKAKVAETKAFASTWHGVCFDSRSPPPGVLACDHAFEAHPDEDKLLQDRSIREKFLEQTGVFPVGPIRVWAMPRSSKLFPAFNPFSWYVAYDDVAPDAARPIAFLAEVHNTPWGEHVFYGWAHNPATQFPYSMTFDKTMHVSPMNYPPTHVASGDKTYTFDIKNPNHVVITLREGGRAAFRAKFAGDEAAASTDAYGSVKAFGEVYYRAAMRLVRGERSFYGYAAEIPEHEQRQNTFVWVNVVAHALMTLLCYMILFPAVAATGGAVDPVAAASPFVEGHGTAYCALVALAVYFAKGWHDSAETLLPHGILSHLLFLAARTLINAPNASWPAVLNIGYLLLTHCVVLQAAPLSRATRVALQALEPIVLQLVAGRAWTYIGLQATLFLPSVSNDEVTARIADEVFATDADGVRGIGSWDVFLTWFLLWVAIRLLSSAGLQVLVHPWRAHPRIIGARAAFHRAAEMSSVSVHSTLNALMMSAFAVRFYSAVLHPAGSIFGGNPHTEFQCCSFGAYCLSDAFLGLVYYTVSRRAAKDKRGEKTPPPCSPPNEEAPRRPASPTAKCDDDEASSSSSRDGSASSAQAVTSPKQCFVVPHDDVGGLCADCGFNMAVVYHHGACLTIACLGVHFLLWRHEFVWTAAFEISSPVLYLWLSIRDGGKQKKGMLADELPDMMPLPAAAARFITYSLFVLAFFVVRILGCAIGLYYLFLHRLPFTFANDSDKLFAEASSTAFKVSFWVTLAAFVPLVAVQGVWFLKLLRMWPAELLPLVENITNVFAGDDWFEVRMLPARRGRGHKKAAAAACASPAVSPRVATRPSGLHAHEATEYPIRERVRLVMHEPWKVLWAFATRGDVGFGEAYVRQEWTAAAVNGSGTSPLNYDAALATALQHLCKVSYAGAEDAATDGAGQPGVLARVLSRLLATPDHAKVDVPDMVTSESRQESVAEHYDGNQDLFNAFQGTTRVYTAAHFGEGLYDPPAAGAYPGDLVRADALMSEELDTAQMRKIIHVLKDLGKLTPGQKVLDLGCGYGELVRLAVQECGASEGVGITNSVEMAKEFNNRVEAVNGGSARVDVADMLELPAKYTGRFDVVTSIESIEAIHYKSYRTMARNVRRALKPGGRAVFQIIHGYGSRNPTIRRKEFMPGTTFVQVYIFPGQQLPYLEYVLDAFRAEGLPCTHVEHSGLHYARTLQIWREKLWYETFKANDGKACAWSQDEYRKFVYYLAWCEAGFREGVIDVARCVFVKA